MSTLTRIGLRALPFVASYAIVLGLMNAGLIGDYVFSIIVTICINIILAASLNLVTGFTGQFSLGHAGFMSIGAYTCALISINFGPTLGDVPAFLLGMLAGAIAAALVGALVGLPTLRLRGDYLAIATLGMAEIIRVVMLNLPITNGAAGLSGIPQVVDWNWAFGFTALTLIVLWNYIRSSQGRRAIAVREDEIAAEAIGVNTTASKVQAFTIGAFFAGIGGGLYASYFYFIKPDQFGFMKSIDILVIVVLGGLGSLSGTVIAAILLAIVSVALSEFSDIRMIIYALVLVLIMIFRPGGLMGSKEITDTVLGKVFRREGKKATVEEAR